jgi:MAP3K TRAFs-binding domain
MSDATEGPLCFVLMPFGKKPDGAGKIIDFDAVYKEIIAPAVAAAGMTVIRADEEDAGGIIHKAMFERLILCEFAVADLTAANTNVSYELGVRHATRPWSTVSIIAEGSRLPFDLAPLRCVPYKLSEDGTPDNVDATSQAIAEKLKYVLKTARELPDAASDSPVFALVQGMVGQQIDREKTDVFREEVRYSQDYKDKLAFARRIGVSEIRKVEQSISDLKNADSGVVVDLFLSYRAVRAWGDMIRLVKTMAAPLAASVLVQEQYALALNRAGEGEQAEAVLTKLIDARGPSSETYGILGRVYKDRWTVAKDDEDRKYEAPALLDNAIDAYLKGFESDWRDAYPGINALTLMSLRDPSDPQITALLPVVSYAVERRIARGKPDYWDFATRLELAVIGGDRARALKALPAALAAVREVWEPETTARNLELLGNARRARGEDVAWIEEVVKALKKKA